MAHVEKTDAVTKKTAKNRRKSRATAANKQVTALELELAKAKAAFARHFGVAARCETAANKPRADTGGLKIRFGEVEWKAKLAFAYLEET